MAFEKMSQVQRRQAQPGRHSWMLSPSCSPVLGGDSRGHSGCRQEPLSFPALPLPSEAQEMRLYRSGCRVGSASEPCTLFFSAAAPARVSVFFSSSCGACWHGLQCSLCCTGSNAYPLPSRTPIHILEGLLPLGQQIQHTSIGCKQPFKLQ